MTSLEIEKAKSESTIAERRKKRSVVEKARAAVGLRGGQKSVEGRKEIAFHTCAKAAMNESKGENVRTTAAAKKVVEALLILMTDTAGTEVKTVCGMENLTKVRVKDVETQIRSTWHPRARDDVLQYVRRAVDRYEKSKEAQRLATVEEVAINATWREDSV
jgi:hypothetical protein